MPSSNGVYFIKTGAYKTIEIKILIMSNPKICHVKL